MCAKYISNLRFIFAKYFFGWAKRVTLDCTFLHYFGQVPGPTLAGRYCYWLLLKKSDTPVLQGHCAAFWSYGIVIIIVIIILILF